MKNFIKNHRFLSGLLSILISVFLVGVVAYAATTIGTNIQTAGTASSTSATTTDYLYVGPDGTEDNIDFTGGDLYVTDDVEIDGSLWFDSGTTTDSLYVAGYASSTGGFYSQGTIEIGGDGLVRGKATTTTAFAVGAGTIDSLDMAGGDLYVQDDVEIDGFASTTSALNTQGTLHVGGSATTSGLTIGTSTSAITNFLFGTCAVDFSSSLAAGESSSTDCVATGITAEHNVVVTPEWLEPGIDFIAASTTANTIRIFVHNATSTTASITTGENTWQWIGVKN